MVVLVEMQQTQIIQLVDLVEEVLLEVLVVVVVVVVVVDILVVVVEEPMEFIGLQVVVVVHSASPIVSHLRPQIITATAPSPSPPTSQ
jgi:hypothetical protein